MSDSEDDYMSDKLLVGCEKADVRPGLLFNSSQKRTHEIYKKREENRAKKPKSYHVQEEETRKAGLSTAISSDNKGFKLLEKMGYKSGKGLGKSTSGITEPIGIDLKSNNAGVGREVHLKNIAEQKIKSNEKILKQTEDVFKQSNSERLNMAKLYKDYFKAQRICGDLDLKNEIMVPQQPFFWSKEMRNSLKQKTEGKKSEESDEEEEEEEEEEEIEEVTEMALSDIILYLRNKYKYCMYCGDFVDENEDEASFCPGYFREDHDD